MNSSACRRHITNEAGKMEVVGLLFEIDNKTTFTLHIDECTAQQLRTGEK